MHKKLIIASVITVAAIVVLFTELVNIIFSFLLTGVVPGTPIVAPYWFMMAVYCTLISIIATPYIERLIKIIYHRRHPEDKQADPARRRTIATPNQSSAA